MSRFIVILCLVIVLFSQKLFAQVDTVTFRFERDIATFKARCHAQKIVGTDTTDFNNIVGQIDTNYTFTWENSFLLTSNGVPRVTYSFNAEGNYTITLVVVHKPSGKSYEETRTVDISDFIRVPNVFTPNGDGVNDLFTIRANGIIPLEISIYSRTGTLIHTSKSPIIVWDGRSSSGAFVSEGIYYYILISDDPNVQAQKGFFYIYDPGVN